MSQTTPLPVVTTRMEDGVAVLTIRNPPVNALGAAVRGALVEALREVESDPAVRAVVLAAEGRTFVAGADISEFGRPPLGPSLRDVVSMIEDASKPVVAAVQGAALGGGLELVLGCHGRVATPAASFGLPEVKLGLLPGAGGTQRLPRLIGAADALRIMTTGEPAKAERALGLGIVDVVTDGDLVQAASTFALAHGAPPKRTRDRHGLGDRDVFEAAAAAVLEKAGQNPSVVACVDAVRSCFESSFEDGLARERAHFNRLRDDPRSKALRHVFFAERAAAKVPGVARDTRVRRIETAAVIGGGTMGGGIAMCFANAGIPVTLIETSDGQLEKGLARLAGNYDTSVRRGTLTREARDERMARIAGKVGLDAAADADVVVEAVFEEMQLKRDIFGTLDGIAKPGALLATNTSYLDVNEIASATSRPADVVGMHFFSPANVMRLLEVVRGARTAPDALVTAMDLGRRLGKISVVSGVCHGFIGNRMLARRTAAAEALLLEGAMPDRVDAALTAFGFRMGPFAMADLAGLDIGWRIRKATGMSAPIADALCEAGRFGQKTGKGYYAYPDGARSGMPDPEVRELIERVSAERGITRRAIGHEEMTERLLYPMINEAARILEEGIAARPGHVDVVWLHGYNWPAATGGPLFHADSLGVGRIVARLDQLSATSGDATLRPAALLRRLAEQGRGFASLEASAA